MQLVGQLTCGVAHDLNSMPSAIMCYSQLGVNRAPVDDRLRSYLHEIQKTADRAANLTRQPLIFCGQENNDSQVPSLNDLILSTDIILRRLIREDIELVVLPDPDLGMMEVDSSQMERVLINLVLNARDAMPNGGKLIIETPNTPLFQRHTNQHPEAAAGEYVTLTVSDNDVGMTEEVRSHPFDPFFTTKAIDQGTGLGLSNCYDIVVKSRGHISIESEPGEGTTFKVQLPRVEGPAESSLLWDEADELPGGSETVLVVEDEPSVREVTAHMLHELGYTVMEVSNGHEALQMAQERTDEDIALTLKDVVMPLIRGKELALKLRAIGSKTKFLLTSGYTEDAVDQHSKFLQKPVTPAVLAHKVREVLGN